MAQGTFYLMGSICTFFHLICLDWSYSLSLADFLFRTFFTNATVAAIWPVYWAYAVAAWVFS